MCVFFFQAEDGIRDLVRSRGLGDVYKRQELIGQGAGGASELLVFGISIQISAPPKISGGNTSVSYTHLTLPTSDLV